jgi:hypothetical protein
MVVLDTVIRGGGGARQWTDLNAEELREEAALMNIIQGETVRLP